MTKIFLVLAGLMVIPVVLFLGLVLAVSTLPLISQKKWRDRLVLRLYSWLCVIGGLIGDGLDAYRI